MTLAETMRRAITGEIIVRTWWGCDGLSGEAFRQWFHERLSAKINREDCRRWRKLSPCYQTSLMRDRIRLHEILGQRIRHRQFETDIVRKRFSHLLAQD